MGREAEAIWITVGDLDDFRTVLGIASSTDAGVRDSAAARGIFIGGSLSTDRNVDGLETCMK